MAQIFTSNQVNHAYVVKSFSTSTKPTKSSNKGTTYLGHNSVDNAIYFMQRGAAGLVRSDLIDLDKIMYVKYTPASKMSRKRNGAFIEINSNALNSGNAYGGQDYILRIAFQNPIGISPDHGYWKHAVAHTSSTTSKNDLYIALGESLGRNFSREAVQMLNMYLVATVSSAKKYFKINLDGTVSTTATDGTTSIYSSGTTVRVLDGILLEEANNASWRLGVTQDKPLVFSINHSTISKPNGNGGTTEVYWADVTYTNGIKITGGEELTKTTGVSLSTASGDFKNGHLAAELEYFSMGERADLYRGMGWPDNRDTEYLIGPSVGADEEFDMIGIHYFYNGSNHAVQKSEKDITLIIPRASTDTTANSLGALATSVKNAIEALRNPLDNRYAPASNTSSGN